MQLRPSKSLSVIGAMKDIQQYKVMKSQADLAPTLAEKAKTMWEWQKKDRAKDVRIKDLTLEKAERSEATAKRELLIEMKTGFAQVASDVMAMNLSQEETTEYLNLAYQAMKDLGPEYADELEDKDGNNIIDMAEIKREDLPKYHDAFYKDLEKLAKPGDVPLTKKFGEDWVRGEPMPSKPTEGKSQSWKSTDKEGKEWISTRNTDGTVTTVPIEGITGKPTKPPGAGTGEEREREALKNKLPEFQRMAKEDPNKLYREKSIQMNDDGTIPTDAWGAPVVLPPAHKVLGKRSTVTAILQAGEHYDDAVELQELLQDPKVASDFRAAAEGGYWDRTKGTWSNRIRHWARKAGIADDSNTATAIGRMQMMASIQRKKFLGSAVTVPELKSVTAWMPSAGDSYETMINKNKLVVVEGKEVFERFLDVYKDQANMAPFYEAFGMKRFSDTPSDSGIDMKSKADMLIQKYSKGQ